MLGFGNDDTEQCGDESVGILVSIDEDMEDGDCLLNNLVRKVDGEVSKELGFGIYKIYVPVARLNEFVTAEFVESVEAPDPDGGPVLMGN